MTPHLERHMERRHGRKLAIFDRDNTLTIDHTGYTTNVVDFAWLPGVLPALGSMAKNGWRFAIATNQSGVGRGFYTLQSARAFNEHLIRDALLQGLHIEVSAICIHVPEDQCECRKPKPGLITALIDEFGGRLESVVVIGDKDSDVDAAVAAGVTGIKVAPGSMSSSLRYLMESNDLQ